MWQKARFIKCLEGEDGRLIGKECWVEDKPVYMPGGYDPISHTSTLPGEKFKMNVVYNSYFFCYCLPEVVKLLPEFSEKVDIVSWEDFHRKKENNNGS